MQKIAWNYSECRKAGKQVNAHQADINAECQTEAVSGKPQMSPIQNHYGGRKPDRYLYTQKSKIAEVQQLGHKVIAFCGYTASHPDDRQYSVK